MPAPGAAGAEGLVLVLWLKNILPWLWMRSGTTVSDCVSDILLLLGIGKSIIPGTEDSLAM